MPKDKKQYGVYSIYESAGEAHVDDQPTQIVTAHKISISGGIVTFMSENDEGIMESIGFLDLGDGMLVADMTSTKV